jgi:ribose transport system ATP-binding protein
VNVDATDVAPRTAVVVRGATKSFGSTKALADFSFDLRVGEVHALVGGNGSGKSTFIKLLAGVYEADAGILVLPDGERSLSSHTPKDARAAGLRFVHQELGIFPSLSVAENLAMGRFSVRRGWRISWRDATRAARDTLTRFNIRADPSALVSSLPMPQRTLLAIARALQDIEGDRGVLVLDEPTAALPRDEAAALIASIRQLAEAGHSIILVTHRLDEIQEAADRVSGLRDGVQAGTIDAATMDRDAIVSLILGHRLPVPPASTARQMTAAAALEVRNLSGGPITNVDLRVHKGEIVGLAGLLGSGRTELLELIYGVREAHAGEVEIDGVLMQHPSPREASSLGMAFVPEDRHGSAVLPTQTVSENIAAGDLGRYFGKRWINDRQLRREVGADVERFHIKAGSLNAPIETLSGGNQQKVVLARWLRRDPKIILLDEPTQGIDVGAREEILALLTKAAEGDAGILVVSSEFEELARLCHRTVVISQGELVAEHRQGVSGHDLLASVLEYVRSAQP